MRSGSSRRSDGSPGPEGLGAARSAARGSRVARAPGRLPRRTGSRVRVFGLWLLVALFVLGGGPAGSPVVWAQSKSGEKRLREILVEAEKREAAAAEFRRQAKTTLEVMQAIERELVEERRTQRNLRSRQTTLGRELDEARAAERDARRDLEGLSAKLGSRLRVLYKLRAGGGLPGLYAATDFQSSLRLAGAFRKILDTDLALFARFRDTAQRAKVAAEKKQRAFDELEGSKSAYLESKRKEMKKLIDKRNQADLLRRKSEIEDEVARELREQAERLEKKLAEAPRQPVQTAACLQRGRLPRPVEGALRLRFGREVEPRYQTVVKRYGIEIVADPGRPVRAVGDGRVVFSGWFKGYGQMVILDHGCEVLSVSGYLETLGVEVDDIVRQGEVIGTVGETGSLSGAGLYFELRKSGKAIDPEKWFGA